MYTSDTKRESSASFVALQSLRLLSLIQHHIYSLSRHLIELKQLSVPVLYLRDKELQLISLA